MKKEKIRERRVSTSDYQAGEYVPFTILWEKQGKDLAGLSAARTYASACAEKMQRKELSNGRAWIKFNEMTGRNEFLFVSSGYRDDTTKVDILRSTGVKAAGAAGAAGGPGGSSGNSGSSGGGPPVVKKEPPSPGGDDGQNQDLRLPT